MTKSGAIILISSVVCLFSLIGITQAQAQAQAQFHVEGKVYCDFCRALFENRLSKPMAGAEVRLQCRNNTDDSVTLTVEGQTDKNGVYSLLVERDHEDEICEMILMKSSMEDCSEIPNEGHAKESARITITSNNGMAETTRHANPLFFVKKQAAPECAEVFKELELLPEEIDQA
ncbi:pollen allergen Sal k 5.0101-like [Nicotiana sylvestris]|uniref:Olee1-like protein n=1 Tax=Nicotiana sylvestris TaxID=4096 RepID=A0A1U7WH82_NICSY|nr:PREDICTED: olee1-like protein [Nicotiana sylvestris]